MKTRHLATALIAAAALVIGGTAVAAPPGSVDVTLKVSYGKYVVKKTCPVVVPSGAAGRSVLDAAVSSGCLAGYTTKTFGSAHYVDSIEGLSEQPGTYWEMRENGVCTDYGLDDFRAGQSDELWFAYNTWALYAAPAAARAPISC